MVYDGGYMAFSFKNQLRMAVPITKTFIPNQTIVTSVEHDDIESTIRHWFPVFDQIIINARQGKLRAYNNLPNHYLLFYDVMENENGKQKWKTMYKIKVFRDCTIKMEKVNKEPTSCTS